MHRALILKPCCLGDVLLATPLAAALVEHARAESRSLQLDWAVDAHSRPALIGNPHLDALIDASHCLRGDLRLGAWLSLLLRIRRSGYDALFVPDRSPLLSLVARLSGIPLRVGLASGWRGFGYNLRVPTTPEDPRHEAEIYLTLARAVGIEPSEPIRPVYRCRPEDRAGVDRILRAHGIDPSGAEGSGQHWIAIHPGGGVNPGMRLTEKRWPAIRYAAMIEGLHARYGTRPLLLGGPSDRDQIDDLLQALSEDAREATIDLCDQLSLAELAALVERCRLYLGNDSGVSKLAAAVGTPVVEIFGPTDANRYGPLPGCGLAVSPQAGPSGDRELRSISDSDPLHDLTAAHGSRIIEAVSVAAVRSAVERLLPR